MSASQPRKRYLRKSTEGAERQAKSIEQQNEVLSEKFGDIDPASVYMDSCSGTSFGRPAYQRLVQDCEAEPQPRDRQGVIEVYDTSRFGRPLRDGEPDFDSFMREVLRLRDVGWELRYAVQEKTGNAIVDHVMTVIHSHEASQYSAKLSRTVRRGKASHAKDGNWIQGSPPYGTIRILASSLRELGRQEMLRPGEREVLVGWDSAARERRWAAVVLEAKQAATGPVVLAGDPETLADWGEAADLYLAGHSLKQIGKRFYAEGRRGSRGGKLSHSFVRNLLSSTPLRGQIEYHETTASGETVTHQINANWEPLVDPDLWDAVQDRLKNTHRTRKKKESFPLQPFCTHCGAPYWGANIPTRDLGQSRRVYRHAPVDQRDDPGMHEAFKAAECKRYQLDATELEEAMVRAIKAERGSPEFESQLRARMVNSDGYQKEAERTIAEAGQELKEILKQQRALAFRIADPTLPEDFLDVVRITVQELSTRKARLQKKQAKAERARVASHTAWAQVRQIINETRNIAAAWSRLDPEERTLIFQHWVVAVGVAVEKIPGRKRGHPMTAVAYLAPSPNSPKLLPLALERAASTSRTTQASSSEMSTEESSSLAPVPPTRPSAQAACPRTNGSGSASALDSTGIASSDPQFPSETQTLRANPDLPARRMAEPRENDSQASGSSAISSNSMSRGESVPGCQADEPGSDSTPCGTSPGPRAAYDASEAVLEKLRLNGHTSWQMSHP